jgi:hypothetical protein
MRQNIFNPDFQDFISALNSSEVAYILVGRYSVILHGYFRTTGDMDIWVQPSAVNYERLQKAFARFGMSVFNMTSERFLDTAQYEVCTFGRPPVLPSPTQRIEIHNIIPQMQGGGLYW